MDLAEVLYGLAQATEDAKAITGDSAQVTLSVSRHTFDRVMDEGAIREEWRGGHVRGPRFRELADGSAVRQIELFDRRVIVECPALQKARARGGYDLA